LATNFWTTDNIGGLMTLLTKPELLSAIFAGLAILISFVTYFRNKTIVKAQIYIELRYRFIEIYDNLPAEYNSETWLPDIGTDEWKRIQQYWYHAFNEWFITNKLDKWQLNSLWRKYYKGAILSGLRNRPLRYVLNRMLDDERGFAGYKSSFEKELDQIWKNSNTESSSIKDGFKTIK
jgi:hypothetical protein